MEWEQGAGDDPTNERVIEEWSRAADGREDPFDDEGDFARRHLLNPALLELLGDVAGKRLLDAGCGQGYLSRMLARRGARMTGVEPADGWYREAVRREREEPLGIEYAQQDLATLSGFEDRFDGVVANMVFQDIPAYEPAVRGCIAALRPGGDLVFSIVHPCFEEPAAEWVRKGYVEVREYLRPYAAPQGFAPLFHRPLSRYVNLVLDSGCALRRLVEPQLPAELAPPGTPHERNAHVPSFLVVHAVKTGEW